MARSGEDMTILSKYGDEHLSTIPETESNELIKSSVENLVTTPSESEDLSKDLSNIESECNVPVCDDFTTFSNLLFDADDDFSSSDDKSFSDEDVPKEIYSNPLFNEEIISTMIDPYHFNAEFDLIESLLNRDTLIISSPKFDSLLEEFSSELAHIDLIPPGINEIDFDPEEEIHLIEKLLYENSSPRPPEEFNSENSDAIIESFSPSPIPVEDSDSLMEEIDLFLTPDGSMPPGIENDDYDSERDIIFLEELLSNDSPSLPENESFHFDVPSSPRPPAKPPDDGIYFEPYTGVFTKVVDDISDNSTRELYVHVTNVLPTLPTLSSMFDTLLPFSSENEDKHACKEKQHQLEVIQELLRKLLNDVQIISEERVDFINTPNWNRPAFYHDDDEDDDEEYTIAISLVLPTVEPDNSLSMGDENLSTIPKKEESSVEDLVPIPTSES
ncbi:hypothetical protein Tco_0786754 [Tanacetum coccineum]